MARRKKKIVRTDKTYKRKKRKVILTEEVPKTETESQEQEAQPTEWIVAPAGPCPAILEGLDDDSIMSWVMKIKMTGNHTVQSCCYWIRDFYDIHGEEHRLVRDWIVHNSSWLHLPYMPPINT